LVNNEIKRKIFLEAHSDTSPDEQSRNQTIALCKLMIACWVMCQYAIQEKVLCLIALFTNPVVKSLQKSQSKMT